MGVSVGELRVVSTYGLIRRYPTQQATDYIDNIACLSVLLSIRQLMCMACNLRTSTTNLNFFSGFCFCVRQQRCHYYSPSLQLIIHFSGFASWRIIFLVSWYPLTRTWTSILTPTYIYFDLVRHFLYRTFLRLPSADYQSSVDSAGKNIYTNNKILLSFCCSSLIQLQCTRKYFFFYFLPRLLLLMFAGGFTLSSPFIIFRHVAIIVYLSLYSQLTAAISPPAFALIHTWAA